MGKQDQALKSLRAMLDETVRAHDLTANGDAIPAMRLLVQAKRLGKQSIAALLSECLGAAVTQAGEVNLPRLAELIGFAMQALCPACRSEVGKKWKEAEDV